MPSLAYLRTLPAMGGGRFAPSLSNYWTDSQSKNGIWYPRHVLLKYIARLNLKVTDYVTGQVKCQIFAYLSLLSSPGNVGVSTWNKAIETAWIVYGILKESHEPLVTSCQVIGSQEAKKGQSAIFCLGGAIHAFKSDFHRERKSDQNAFWRA